MSVHMRDFDRVVFFTGAGISVESGIPTYRGKGGVWKEYDYHRYACQNAFDEAPERVWEFHNYRRGVVARAAPNRGHEAIARAQRSHPNVRVITQNIDGLHQRAGAKEVLELHGSLWRVRCDACGLRRASPETALAELRCTCDQAFLRPDITWFGDALDAAVFAQARAASTQATLFVSVGTSGVVYPAAYMPELAKDAGAYLVEVNPEHTELTELHDEILRGNASELLPPLVD